MIIFNAWRFDFVGLTSHKMSVSIGPSEICQEMVRQVPVPVVQYIDKPVPRRSLRAVEKVVPFPQVFHEAWGLG